MTKGITLKEFGRLEQLAKMAYRDYVEHQNSPESNMYKRIYERAETKLRNYQHRWARQPLIHELKVIWLEGETPLGTDD